MVDDHGRLDILINNAGILRWERMVDTSFESWNEVVAVNQTGVFLGMQAVAPQMIEQQSGSIVNISSVGGLQRRERVLHLRAPRSGRCGA